MASIETVARQSNLLETYGWSKETRLNRGGIVNKASGLPARDHHILVALR